MAEGLPLAADVAVGDDDDAAGEARVLRKRHRGAQRAHQFGAAAAALVVDHPERAGHVFGAGRHRSRRHHAGAAGEQHDVEVVDRT